MLVAFAIRFANAVATRSLVVDDAASGVQADDARIPASCEQAHHRLCLGLGARARSGVRSLAPVSRGEIAIEIDATSIEFLALGAAIRIETRQDVDLRARWYSAAMRAQPHRVAARDLSSHESSLVCCARINRVHSTSSGTGALAEAGGADATCVRQHEIG